VEVDDGSLQLPSPRNNSTLAGTGRGLRLLQLMVDRWGAQPHADGKTVWFELSEGDREGGISVIDVPDDASSLVVAEDGTVHVELLNVPLLLHVAWHQLAEALMREYLLVNIGEDLDLDEVQSHAAASDALALMRDHLPAPGVGEDVDTLMATAVEPAVSSVREVLPVPPGSVPHFRVLDETLDAALALADAGGLLTPPTQPELRAFRRWVCRQVEDQSGGGDPTPFADLSHEAPPPPRAPLAWSTHDVTTSHEALIAADDSNGIIAVSRPALEILGYDDPAELVGRRLVAVIPPRFRQAHLAGFTLHLAIGRSPLLDRPVVVPVLRRDGSETMIELTVRSEALGAGRHVFVATVNA
jgi:PAS domain S-box-containing protein